MMAKFKKTLSDYQNETDIDPYIIHGVFQYGHPADISKMFKLYHSFILNMILIYGFFISFMAFFSIPAFILSYFFFILPMVVLLRSLERKYLRYDDISYQIWVEELKYFGSTSRVV